MTRAIITIEVEVEGTIERGHVYDVRVISHGGQVVLSRAEEADAADALLEADEAANEAAAIHNAEEREDAR